jgi:putative phosphoribosyl transferase
MGCDAGEPEQRFNVFLGGRVDAERRSEAVGPLGGVYLHRTNVPSELRGPSRGEVGVVTGWAPSPLFADRAEAGRLLAERLAHVEEADSEAVVLGLPRGGVPVATAIAERLGSVLDVVVVRKLGVPTQPELAMGAIGEGGVRIIEPEIMRWAGVATGELQRVELRERDELDRRAAAFRSGHPRVGLSGRTAIVVDDGIATGSTARAACQVVRALGAARTVLAVPVAPPAAMADLALEYDETCCLATPEPFYAVGIWYEAFDQTSDEEVVELLEAARRRQKP